MSPTLDQLIDTASDQAAVTNAALDKAEATVARHMPTPGPWSVGVGWPTTIYAQCVPIAHTSTGDSNDWIPGMRFLYPENAVANARLIAAAPSMISALMEAYELLSSLPVPDGKYAIVTNIASVIHEATTK